MMIGSVTHQSQAWLLCPGSDYCGDGVAIVVLFDAIAGGLLIRRGKEKEADQIE